MTDDANIKDHALVVIAADIGEGLTGGEGPTFPNGEINTASNLTDVGLFHSKEGVDLQFRGIDTETPSTLEIKLSDDEETLLINDLGGGGSSGLQINYQVVPTIDVNDLPLEVTTSISPMVVTTVNGPFQVEITGAPFQILSGGGGFEVAYQGPVNEPAISLDSSIYNLQASSSITLQANGTASMFLTSGDSMNLSSSGGMDLYSDDIEITGFDGGLFLYGGPDHITFDQPNLSSAIPFSDGTDSALDTAAQAILEAINEINSIAVQDRQSTYDQGGDVAILSGDPYTNELEEGGSIWETFAGTDYFRLSVAPEDLGVLQVESLARSFSFKSDRADVSGDAEIKIDESGAVSIYSRYNNTLLLNARNSTLALDGDIVSVYANPGALSLEGETSASLVSDDGPVYVTSSTGVITVESASNNVLVNGVQFDSDENVSLINSLTFDTTPSGISHTDGMIYWDSVAHGPAFTNDRTNTVHQIGREMWRRIKNDIGAVGPNGAVVYISGWGTDNPEVKLASATDKIQVESVLALLTEDINDQDTGEAVIIGQLNDINTSSYTEGQIVYLSETPGEWTTMRPAPPNYPIRLGTIGKVDAVNGCLLVNLVSFNGTDTSVNLEGLINGSASQLQSVSFSVTGTPGDYHVWANVTNGDFPSNDLPIIVNSKRYLLDTTSSGPAQVELIQGTTETPALNILYVEVTLGSPDVIELKASTTTPTGNVAILGHVSVRDEDVTGGISNIVFGWQRFNNVPDNGVSDGFMTYALARLRQEGAKWGNLGVTPTVTVSGGGASVNVTHSSGFIWQLHNQSFSGTDGSLYTIVNHPDGPMVDITDIAQIDKIADGTILNNNDIVAFNIFACQSSAGGVDRTLIMLPSGVYDDTAAGRAAAIADTDITANTNIPSGAGLENISIRTARIILRYNTGALWDNVLEEETGTQTYQDERGKPLGGTSGGGIGGSVYHNFLIDLQGGQTSEYYHLTQAQWTILTGITSGDVTNWDAAYAHSQVISGNPHSVTKTEVGLSNVQNVDQTNASNIVSGTLSKILVEDYANWDAAYTHSLVITGNPHSVTKTDVGLSNVLNVDTTNASNITSGTLSKLLVEDYANWDSAYSHSLLTSGNPHSVTKTEIGLSNVQNVDQTDADNITSGNLANARLTDSGVTANTYPNATVTVNSKGIVTSASSGSGGSSLDANFECAASHELAFTQTNSVPGDTVYVMKWVAPRTMTLTDLFVYATGSPSAPVEMALYSGAGTKLEDTSGPSTPDGDERTYYSLDSDQDVTCGVEYWIALRATTNGTTMLARNNVSNSSLCMSKSSQSSMPSNLSGFSASSQSYFFGAKGTIQEVV